VQEKGKPPVVGHIVFAFQSPGRYRMQGAAIPEMSGDDPNLETEADALLNLQRDNGGWAQTRYLGSGTSGSLHRPRPGRPESRRSRTMAASGHSGCGAGTC
jgi:hypothetical protein